MSKTTTTTTTKTTTTPKASATTPKASATTPKASVTTPKASATTPKASVTIKSPVLKNWISALCGKYHKQNLIIDKESGTLKVTSKGQAFFSARLTAMADGRAPVEKAMKANADVKGSTIAGLGTRKWLKDSAIVNGHNVAMPEPIGAGDGAQQLAFALLCMSADKA